MRNKFKQIIFLTYTIFELILVCLLLFYDFKDTNIVRYIFIITNFVFVLINLIINKNKHNNTIICIVGLFFTCLADFGLIILGDYYELSVTLFTCSQLAYMFIIGIDKINILIRIIMIVIMEVIAYIVCNELYSVLVFVTMIYISIFIVNIVFSFINKKNILFSIGLILFLLCDICVGISSFDLFTNQELTSLCGKLIFYFYLPSQYLIAITNIHLKEKL